MSRETRDQKDAGVLAVVAQSTKDQADSSLAHNTEQHKKSEVGSCGEGTSLTGVEGGGRRRRA